MIQTIGIKRIIIIAVLIAVAGGMGAGNYLYLVPKNQKLERELRTIRGQISTKRAETQRLAEEFAQIQEQKNYFTNLESAGFFSNQNRVIASRRIEDIQGFTKVLATRYDIKPATVEQNKLAEEAGHVVLDSRISLSVDAIDDIDIYTFIFLLENSLPGHVSVRSVRVDRMAEINEAVLRSIGLGQPTIMVKGTVEFDWRTMVPRAQVEGMKTGL